MAQLEGADVAAQVVAGETALVGGGIGCVDGRAGRQQGMDAVGIEGGEEGISANDVAIHTIHQVTGISTAVFNQVIAL